MEHGFKGLGGKIITRSFYTPNASALNKVYYMNCWPHEKEIEKKNPKFFYNQL